MKLTLNLINNTIKRPEISSASVSITLSITLKKDRALKTLNTMLET